MQKLKQKLIVAFITAGLSSPAAFVAYDLTLPSEGYTPTIYLDTGNLQTFCVGHLALKGEVLRSSYTEQECMTIFASDWKKHLSQLDSVVKVPYKSEWERQALTDFTFNNGIGNVKSSTLIKKLNSGDHVGACQQLTRWTKGRVRGVLVTLRGLVTRRDNTIPYCLGELTPDKQTKYNQFEREYNEALKRQKEDTEKL